MSKRLFEPQELSVRREERGSKGRVHQESVWHLGGGWVAEWGAVGARVRSAWV